MNIITLVLFIIICPLARIQEYAGEFYAREIYCRAEGGIVTGIISDGEKRVVGIRMIQPVTTIHLENRANSPRSIVLKCKNINPAYFTIYSRSIGRSLVPLETKISSKGKNYALVSVNIPKKTKIKVLAKHTLPAKDKFTFCVLGDPQGKTDVFKGILNKVQKSDSLFTIILGDVVEEGVEKDYVDFIRSIQDFPAPLYFTIGNHDITFGGRKIFERELGPSEYSFDVGKFHFIMLDSSLWSLKEGQWEWLEKELSANKNNFVFMHVPPFSPIQRFEDYTLAWKGQKSRFISLMSKYKVRAVFSGHIHGYQKEVVNGVPYYITAGGGANPHMFAIEGGYHHFLIVDVDGENFKTRVVKADD